MKPVGVTCFHRPAPRRLYKGSHQDLFQQTDLTESNTSVNPALHDDDDDDDAGKSPVDD